MDVKTIVMAAKATNQKAKAANSALKCSYGGTTYFVKSMGLDVETFEIFLYFILLDYMGVGIP